MKLNDVYEEGILLRELYNSFSNELFRDDLYWNSDVVLFTSF